MIQFPEKGEKSDAVMIRGTSDQVKGAKAELSAIAAVKLEEGYTESVECPAEHIKFMIGKGGKTKQELQEKFDVTLILPSKDSQEATLTILGKEKSVKSARAEIQKRLDILKETKEITVAVPKKFHVQFIRRGKNGNVLSALQADFAGTNIKVPKQESDEEVFTINGPINCVEDVKQEILNFVERFENTAEILVELPCKNEDIRSLIGTQGANINKVQDDHNVEIKIERAEAAEGEDVSDKTVKAKLTGHKDKLEAAKAALLAMCPKTVEYEMPSEYHGILLGQRGAGIRKLCEELQITIKVPKKQDNGETLNSITLKGTDDKLDNAVKVLDERKAGYADEAKSRYLKSYQLELAVPVEFHSKLIGIGGENITKLRDEFDVNIQMPDRSKGDSEIIKITGFQENAENAAKAIESFCDNFMQYVIKDVQIENSVHRRIIGQRGRGVRKLMSDHQVEIKFPRSEDENKEMVRVSGPPNNVDEAIEALTALEEEFLQEVGEDDVYDTRYKPSVPGQQALADAEERQKGGRGRGGKSGQYNAPKDAPWTGDFPLINAGGGDATQGSWAGGKPSMRK
jgi:polyribonucleotide nucleotidyltransferase